jgi:hypothetical protein
VKSPKSLLKQKELLLDVMAGAPGAILDHEVILESNMIEGVLVSDTVKLP